MDITMSRVCLASDTCDIYFTYAKVNHLLYTCSLGPFENGILLDTSPVCMHRYCRSFMDVEEECKRQGTTTPSAREAWKRRRKKTELLKLQRPDIRARGRTSGACVVAHELHQQTAEASAAGHPARVPGHPAPCQSPDIRPFPRKSGIDDRTHPKFGHFSPDIRPEPRTSGASRSPGHPAPGTSLTAAAQPPSTISGRTSGASPGHPAPRQSPDIRRLSRKSGIERQNAPEVWPLQPGHPA